MIREFNAKAAKVIRQHFKYNHHAKAKWMARPRVLEAKLDRLEDKALKFLVQEALDNEEREGASEGASGSSSYEESANSASEESAHGAAWRKPPLPWRRPFPVSPLDGEAPRAEPALPTVPAPDLGEPFAPDVVQLPAPDGVQPASAPDVFQSPVPDAVKIPVRLPVQALAWLHPAQVNRCPHTPLLWPNRTRVWPAGARRPALVSLEEVMEQMMATVTHMEALLETF